MTEEESGVDYRYQLSVQITGRHDAHGCHRVIHGYGNVLKNTGGNISLVITIVKFSCKGWVLSLSLASVNTKIELNECMLSQPNELRNKH